MHCASCKGRKDKKEHKITQVEGACELIIKVSVHYNVVTGKIIKKSGTDSCLIQPLWEMGEVSCHGGGTF